MMLSTRRLPEGVIALFLAMACTTSSADKLYIRNFSGLTLISTDLRIGAKGRRRRKPGHRREQRAHPGDRQIEDLFQLTSSCC